MGAGLGHPPESVAVARAIYRQARAFDDEHHTAASRHARTQAQDWLAALILPSRRGVRMIRAPRRLPERSTVHGCQLALFGDE